jgi:hypothetical protein
MTLPVHWATPYLRVRVTSGDAALVVEDRRALFGLVPVRRRRVEVPYADLDTARIKNVARWSCLIPAVVVGVTIFLTGVPILVDVALALVGILLLLMTFIRGIRVERTDGHTWTFPICRTHEFDASLAVLDALHRRDVARSSTP